MSNSRNGAIFGALVSAEDAWLTSPNHEGIPVMFLGEGKLPIVSIYFVAWLINAYWDRKAGKFYDLHCKLKLHEAKYNLLFAQNLI